MAHGGLFAIYAENIQDASGHIAVREKKVADGVLRHLVHGLHQGDHYYRTATHTHTHTHTQRFRANVNAIAFTITRELTGFLHRFS